MIESDSGKIDIDLESMRLRSLEDFGELQGDCLWIVDPVISAEHGNQMGWSQVDHDCSYLTRTVLCKSLGNIGLAQVVSPQKFITLSKHIERLGVVLGQKSGLKSSSSIKNAAIIEDSLGSNQNTVYAMHIVASLVISDQLTSHAFQN